MSEPRTTIDLIGELDIEAQKFLGCALMVNFKSTTELVFSGAENRLALLDDAVKRGGEPVAMLACGRLAEGEIGVYARPLREFVDAPGIDIYLGKLTRNFAANLAENLSALEAAGDGRTN
jgi:hypothetical protein